MAVSPLPGIGGVAPSFALPPAASNGSSGADFGTAMTNAIDGLQSLQTTSNTLAVAAVTGDLTDISAATIASTRAAVTLELVAAVRNRGVEAFTEIMRMQA